MFRIVVVMNGRINEADVLCNDKEFVSVVVYLCINRSFTGNPF